LHLGSGILTAVTSSVRERTTIALRELSKVAGEAEANHWPKLAAALRATCATAEARLESRDLNVVVAGGGEAKRALLNQLAGDTLFPPGAAEPDGCLVVLRRAPRVGYVARLVDGRVEDFARLSPDRSTQLADAVATATRELSEIDQRLAQMGVELEERKRVEAERTRAPTKSAFAFFMGWLEALLRIFRPRPQLKSPRVVSVMIARRDVERSIEEAQREREKAEVTLRRVSEEAGTHDAERQRAFVAAIQSLTDAAARGRDEYRDARTALGKLMVEKIAAGDEPSMVAEVVLTAATAARPKIRYTAGSVASRVRWLRRLAPAAFMDAGIRKDLRLDAVPTSPSIAF